MASGYAAVGLLGTTLIVGPWNIVRNRPNPVSTDLRRDIGIWAALLGLLHTIVGLQVHMQGKFWLYFVFPPEERRFFPLRYDPFGFANYTGLGSTLVLLLLLALSNDLSLRRLGTRRWKFLQRWNYAAFVLVVAHGIVYQFLEKRDFLFVGLLAAAVLIPGAMQLAGYRKRKAREVVAAHRGSPSVPIKQ
jgi:sulfoxide reductase heme-binding subunit YedZ